MEEKDLTQEYINHLYELINIKDQRIDNLKKHIETLKLLLEKERKINEINNNITKNNFKNIIRALIN